MQKTLLLALGANIAGAWGKPQRTLGLAVEALGRAGVRVVAKSKLYCTRAVGPGVQHPYFNAVVEARTGQTQRELLRTLKAIERQAGRRFGRVWGPRCLDLDLIDYAGARRGNPRRSHRQGQLVLPHPELHKRAFVLVPLLDVAPRWRHPRLGRSARSLLAGLPLPQRRGVGRSLAFPQPACEK